MSSKLFYYYALYKHFCFHPSFLFGIKYVYVSEIRVLILTSRRTRIYETFLYNILQNSQKYSNIFCSPIFTKRVVLCD
jgi:hypothetical protein